jgi:plastocyanin
MKRVILAAIVVAAAGVFAFDAPAQGADTVTATIINFAFEHGACGSEVGDGNFSIKAGDTIHWTNCTLNTTHSVTGSFGSTDILPGGSYEYVFTTPGDFAYHCRFHSQMTGSVHVTGAATTTTTTQQTTSTTHAATTTTAKPTTTTSTTIAAATTTTGDINGVFDDSTSTPESTTTIFSTGTTRALGQGGDSGTSAGVIAALILGLGAVGTAAALIIRRMRAGSPPS